MSAADSKTCTKCGETKPGAEFRPVKRGGLFPHCRQCERERAKLYRAANPDKCKQVVKEWAASNAGRRREYGRNWRAENSERAREYKRRWNDDNPRPETAESRARRRAKYHADPQKWQLERQREWAKRTGYNTVKTAARRARMMNAPKIEKIDRAAIIERDKRTCHLCGLYIADPKQITLDHVIPLARGGAHTADNLRAAHWSCNSSKKDKILD